MVRELRAKWMMMYIHMFYIGTGTIYMQWNCLTEVMT